MKTILLIDNDHTVIENVTELLENYGYHVIGATESQAGIREARDKAPDLILCDIILPLVDGFGVLSALKDDPVTRDIPFIFLSALSSDAFYNRSQDMGAIDLIEKPFSMRQLLQSVQMALGD